MFLAIFSGLTAIVFIIAVFFLIGKLTCSYACVVFGNMWNYVLAGIKVVMVSMAILSVLYVSFYILELFGDLILKYLIK